MHFSVLEFSEVTIATRNVNSFAFTLDQTNHCKYRHTNVTEIFNICYWPEHEWKLVKKNADSSVTNRNPDIIDFLMIAEVREHGNESLKYMKSKVPLLGNHLTFHLAL